MAQRRRILLWHWGRLGGGPRYTLELAAALAARPDVEVHLTYSRQAELAPDLAGLGLPGFAVDTYRSFSEFLWASRRLPALRRRFAAYVRDHGIDTVVTTMPHLWDVAVVPVIRPAGARYLLTLHDAKLHPGEESRLRHWAMGQQVRAADSIVVLSRHVQDQLTTCYGYPPEHTRVIPLGAFVFTSQPPRRYPEGRPFRLLFFGRILPYKGLDLLLEAYGQLRRRYGGRVTLSIAGSGDLAPYAAALAGLEGVAVHNGWIAEEEVGRYLEPADLMVLPYREASQSGVATTAYGAGLPVVATPVGGLAEQVVEGETGLVARAITAGALADCLAVFLDDPAFYERASARALAYAQESLSWNAVASGFLDAVALANASRPDGDRAG